MTDAPCLCGHDHGYTGCADCACGIYSPDYVAQARAVGVEPTAHLRAITREVAEATGWHRPGTSRRTCVYCDGLFYPTRVDARTCSGACRVARHRALAYSTDADVPTPALRRDCWARDRALATGRGLLTRREQYEADLRARDQANVIAIAAAGADLAPSETPSGFTTR